MIDDIPIIEVPQEFIDKLVPYMQKHSEPQNTACYTDSKGNSYWYFGGYRLKPNGN